MSPLLRRIVAAGALGLFPCLLLFPIFLGQCLVPANLLRDVYPWRTDDPKSLVPWNPLQFDGITQFYPWRLYASECWHRGVVPLWNPHQFCGAPFLANAQSAVLYPPNLLFVLLPVRYAFGVSAVVHLFLTGVFLYLFLTRALKISRVGAHLGAVIWQLSTWQVSWLALPTFVCTSTWLPLALLFVWRVAQKPSASRACALGAVLGVMLLAGHFQIAFYCVLLTLAYAIFCIATQKPSLLPALGAAAAALGVFILIAAPQLLPTLELSRLSPRAGGTPTASDYAAYVHLAMPAFHLVTLFVPQFYGRPGEGTYWGATNYAENACYVSVLGLALALAAGLRKHQNREIWFFAGAALVALLLAIGTPLNAILFFGVPGFAATGSPARVLVIWTLCTSVLSAFGADALLRREKPYAALGAMFGLALLAFGLASITIARLSPAALQNIAAAGNDLRLFAGLLIAASAVMALYLRGTLTRPIVSVLLIGLAGGDLLLSGYGYNPAVAPSDVYPVTPVIAWLEAHAAHDRIMPVNRRWSLYQPPPAVLPPNGATVYGLYDLQGYDSLQTREYKEFANALNGNRESSPQENGNMVFTFGVGSVQARSVDARYLISLTPLDGFGAPVFMDGHVAVYEDTQAIRVPLNHGPAADVENMLVNPAIRDWWRTYQPASFRLGLYLGCIGLLILASVGIVWGISRRRPALPTPGSL